MTANDIINRAALDAGARSPNEIRRKLSPYMRARKLFYWFGPRRLEVRLKNENKWLSVAKAIQQVKEQSPNLFN